MESRPHARGACTYISLAAAIYTEVKIVAVGEDFARKI